MKETVCEQTNYDSTHYLSVPVNRAGGSNLLLVRQTINK